MEKAIEKNLIIYLQTGLGKTYIALMLIKELSSSLEKPYDHNEGKRTIFLCETVPLVQQQANFLRIHHHLNVGDYFGDKLIGEKQLDSWDQAIWTEELKKNQILVMTPQILVDMIQHSFIGKLYLII